MAEIDLNQVLANNLRHYMDKANLSQQALADKCGISQRTVSNYLNPNKRDAGNRGKPGSAKLTEVQMLAGGLGVKAWELLRDYQPGEREAYQAIETVYLQLRANASPAALPPTAAPTESVAAPTRTRTPTRKVHAENRRAA